MIRNILKRLSIAVMCIFLLAGCGNTAPQEEVQLTEQWETYLTAKNASAEILYWAYDHVEGYAKTNTWEDLVQARAAVRTASALLEKIEVPKFVLSEETYDLLLEQGIEADAVRAEEKIMKTTITQNMEEMKSLQAQLYNDIYFKTDFENLGKLVKLDRKNLDLDLETYAYQTNYLLLQMKDHSLWDRMEEEYPAISAVGGQWNADPKELELSAMKAMDGMEEVQTGMEECLGASEYSMYLVQEAVENDDLTLLKPEINQIENVPGQFPLPVWTDEELPFEYYFQQGEETVVLKPGQTVDPDSYLCISETADVQEQEIMDYISELDFYELEYYNEWNEDKNEFTLTVLDGDSTMMIVWTEDKTKIFIPSPAADLVPELVYATGCFT